jgi:L-threonylcarbamoyladenylate synthase
MDRFWPGALTIVLPLQQTLELGGDGSTVGVRCPAHPVPRALCAMVGPLATTSANLHGAPPAEEALAVCALPGVALVLDAGSCAGLPSTVVDCSTPEETAVLRHGRVPWNVIQEALRLEW